jgi:hypothetical protein
MTTPALPANKIAFIIDGVIQDVFHTEDRLAALLLSNPIIKDVTTEYEALVPGTHMVGWHYDGTSSYSPPIAEVAVDPATIIPAPDTATSNPVPTV